MNEELCPFCGAYWDCGCTARFWDDPVFHAEIVQTRAEFQFKQLTPAQQESERRRAVFMKEWHEKIADACTLFVSNDPLTGPRLFPKG